MKSLFTLSGVAAVLVLAGGLTLHACKKPSDGVEVTVNTNIYTSPMLFNFVNANREGTGTPGSFDVTISGPDAALVLTPEGKKTFKVQGGMLALVLQKTAAPSPDRPVKFSIYAAADGFAPTAQNITITSDSLFTQNIALVDYNQPPAGAAAKLYTATLTGGVFTAGGTTTTTASATTPQIATVEFPANTKFFGENGAQITSGNLDARIIYYGTTTDASLNAFPGGYNANNVIGEDGKAIADGATFVTAGFTSLHMKVGTTDVKTFSAPLKVTMELNPDYINPNTSVKVKANDKIPVYSLDEKTGQWKWEANGTVTASGSKLVVVYNVAHLSTWSLSFQYSDASNSCKRARTNPLKVIVKSPGGNFNGSLYLKTAAGHYLTNQAGGWAGYTAEAPFSFYGTIPNVSNVKAVVYNQLNQVLAESEPFSPCTTNEVVVNVPAANVPKNVTVNLSLTAQCTNKNINATVTNGVQISVWENNKWVFFRSVYLSDGKGSVILVDNKRYKVSTYYNNKSYGAELEFAAKSFDFNSTQGTATLTGKAVYDAAKSTYTATGNIAISCN